MDGVEVNGYTIEPGANLEGTDLSGVDLRQANLEGVNLYRANLQGTNFQGAYLGGACLKEANLQGANLREADLGRANLKGADLTGACLVGADLSKAKLAGVKCYGTSFTRANLTEVVLTGAQLWGSDLTRADLTKANLSGANVWMSDFGASNLTEADLTEADLGWAWSESPDNGPVLLQGANLSGANLSDAKLRNAIFARANLSRANLFSADLHGADLSEADFTGADLAESDFVGANLRKANFTGARFGLTDFTRADLTGANLDVSGKDPGLTLTGANLTKANLAGAHLSYQDLRFTDLSGANLAGADLTNVDLEGAVADDSTIWPGDLDPRVPSTGVEKDALADPVPVVQEVRSLAATVGIQRLCHFTRVDLLPEIFRTGQILPTSELLLRNPACTRNDYDRRDNHLGFVSCSVQYPNLWVLDRFRDRYPDSEGWVILILRPNRLWATGTLFSPVNAALESGRHVSEGLTGLEAMFQPNPPSKHYRFRGPDHLSSCPTDNQAEVLVPDGVPTADVVGILVETHRRVFDIGIELFSSPYGPDGQWRKHIPGSPWVEHNPELFDSGRLAACVWKGVEIPVRRERY